MNNKLNITLILALSIGSAYAKPPAKDSVHGGSGLELLDNITPNALGGGGDSGGGQWTGYEHLKGKSLSVNFSCSVGVYTVIAKVDGLGNPYIRCLFSGGGSRGDTGWRLAENCTTTLSGQGMLSPRGLSGSGPAGSPTCYNSAAW